MSQTKDKPDYDGSFPSPFPAEVAFCASHTRLPEKRTILPGEALVLGAAASGKRRLEFALGRACARTALARLGFPDARRQPIVRIAGRQPQWPGGVVGTITHAQGRAAAAVAWMADYRGLGVDLEPLRAMSERTRARILVPEEQRLLAGLPESRRALAALLVFSCKESVFKALNPLAGGFQGFQAAEIQGIVPIGTGVTLPFRWQLRESWSPQLPEGTQGDGAYHLSGNWLLTAAWLPRD